MAVLYLQMSVDNISNIKCYMIRIQLSFREKWEQQNTAQALSGLISSRHVMDIPPYQIVCIYAIKNFVYFTSMTD